MGVDVVDVGVLLSIWGGVGRREFFWIVFGSCFYFEVVVFFLELRVFKDYFSKNIVFFSDFRDFFFRFFFLGISCL